MAKSYVTWIVHFLRNCPSVFQSCVISHSHQHHFSVPVHPHTCQHLVQSVFLILAIFTICSGNSLWFEFASLGIHDVEYLFKCSFSICMSLLGCWFLYYWVLSYLYILYIRSLSDICILNICPPVYSFLFIWLKVPLEFWSFHFDETSFLQIVPLLPCWRNVCLTWAHKDFLSCFISEILCFQALHLN